jgi:glycerophosphoryl diester phosphodiesterase
VRARAAAALALALAACRAGVPDAAPSPNAIPAAARTPNVAARGAAAAPLVIAHRGASGHRPEHTLGAYDLAIAMGADYVEPDVVSTRDSVLVARHENEIGGTTDAARRFPERRRTRVVDGDSVTGWFVEDLTLAELRTLRARERLPFRSRAHDGAEPVPTLDEVLALVARRARETGRRVGVYPELKHPTHFRALGLPLEDLLVAALRRHGLDRADAPVFVQSFEPSSLRRLRGMTRAPLVQLVGADSARMATPAGLAEIARYAQGVGVEKSLVQPVDAAGTLLPPTTLVRDAHAAGLAVHVWTLRSDAALLPRAYGGDPAAEWRRFAALGVDGMFGDFPDVGVAALRR